MEIRLLACFSIAWSGGPGVLIKISSLVGQQSLLWSDLLLVFRDYQTPTVEENKEEQCEEIKRVEYSCKQQSDHDSKG